MALEPVSCWPGDGLAAAIDRGQALVIGAGATLSAWMTLALFERTSERVTGMDRDGLIAFAS